MGCLCRSGVRHGVRRPQHRQTRSVDPCSNPCLHSTLTCLPSGSTSCREVPPSPASQSAMARRTPGARSGWKVRPHSRSSPGCSGGGPKPGGRQPCRWADVKLAAGEVGGRRAMLLLLLQPAPMPPIPSTAAAAAAPASGCDQPPCRGPSRSPPHMAGEAAASAPW